MRRGEAAGAAAVALLVGATACRPGAGRPDGRNLVLITLDTTRADRLGCYGAKSVKTPNLDSIAAGGTVFDRAFTTAPITGPAHASILSGTFPPFHQVRDNDVYRVPADLPWLPSILKARGYATAGIVAAFPLRAGVGFSRGFDYYGDHLEAPQGSLAVTNLHTVGVASRPGDRVSAEFRAWLEKSGGREPFFVWLHYYDPHFPYEPPPGYEDLNPDHPYDGEIAFLDECVGTVLRSLRERGLERRTGLIAVADHGEGLKDHGESTHGLLLYNETVRVPLVVRLPWMKAQRSRQGTTVSVADVTPTVLEALGVDAGPARGSIQGRSLVPLLADGADPSVAAGFGRRPLYFETFYTYHHYGWSPLTGFVLGGRKYIHGPSDELYDLEVDMAEAHDRAGSPEAAEMSGRLPSLTAELAKGRPAAGRHEPTREEIAKLRSLGYLGGVSAPDVEGALARVHELPNPKDSMEVFFRHNDILVLVLQNKLREAREQARVMAESDPTNKTGRVMFATLSVRLGFMEAADQAWDGIVRDFSDKDVLFSAGSHFLARRDLVRARQCLERVAVQDPGDVEVLTRLGDVAAAEGDHAAARRSYEKALAIDPAFRDALVGLAISADRTGDPGAGARFVTVTGLYPFDPGVSLNYGVYLARHGRGTEAAEHFRKAAAFSDGPVWVSAQFALAEWHRANGEGDAARNCLREIEVRTNDAQALTRARQMLSELGGR